MQDDALHHGEGQVDPIDRDGPLALALERYLLDTSARQDPYGDYASIREIAPVYRTRAGIWIVTGYEACTTLMRDPRISRWAAARTEMAAFVSDDPVRQRAVDIYSTMIMHLDPPDHTRIRKLVRSAFLPSIISQWRERTKQITRGLVGRAAKMDRFDVLKELAYPLPEKVICEMLDVPHADHDKWTAWTEAFTRYNRIQEEPEVMDEIQLAMVAFCDYVRALVQERRAKLGDDLVSMLVRAEEEGEVLSEDEVISAIILLIGAGHETTANMIGNSVFRLLTEPDQRAELVANPEKAEAAVREYARMFSSVHMGNNRMTIADIEYEGVRIPEGSLVIFLLSAANRDPAVFPDPDVADFARQNHHRSVAFGSGAHFCPGKQLAEMEAACMLREIATRLPGLALINEPQLVGFTTSGFDALLVENRTEAAQ